MSTIELLALAHDQFGEVLASTRADDWDTATPCEGWAVSDLVNHAVCGELLSEALLGGATSAEAIAALPTLDLAAAQERYPGAARASYEAFAAPGALERIVHHPMGDIPASQMLGFRVGDLTQHRWDLARSIGADESLHPELVTAIWAQLQPIAPIISTLGVFGEGPSGSVGEDAELQLRLLDLSGRRP